MECRTRFLWTTKKRRWWLFLLADARAITGESASATGLPNEQRNSLRNAAKTSRSGWWLGSGDLELAAKLVIEARRIWVLRLIAFPMIIPASLAVLGLVSISDRSKEWIAGPPILLLLIYAWLVVMFGRTHTQIDAKSKVRTLFQRPHLLDLGRNRSES